MKKQLKYLLLLLGTFLPSILRLTIWKWLGFRVGLGAHVAPLSVVVADTIEIGPGAVIGPLTLIYRPAKIVMGERSRIASFVRVVGFGEFHLAQQTFVALACLIDVTERFVLGPRSQIGPRGTFYTHGASGLIFNRSYPFRNGDIVIGSDTWLAMSCTVYPEVRIGSRCVIMPCLTISRDIEDDSMLLPPAEPWRRVPARYIQGLPNATDDRKLEMLRGFVERLVESHGGQVEKGPDVWIYGRNKNRLLLRVNQAKEMDPQMLQKCGACWSLDWTGAAQIPIFCFRTLQVLGPHTVFAEELAAFLCEHCGTHFVFADSDDAKVMGLQ